MPQSLITRLGLNLKAYRTHKKRIYSNVEFNYGENKETRNKKESNQLAINLVENEMDISVAVTANGHKIHQNIDDEKLIKEINYLAVQNEAETQTRSEKIDDQEEDNDGDELEDWERHEALHDDVTKQDRTSPYFYENEIELKWEKGGSGLVFYTVSRISKTMAYKYLNFRIEINPKRTTISGKTTKAKISTLRQLTMWTLK